MPSPEKGGEIIIPNAEKLMHKVDSLKTVDEEKARQLALKAAKAEMNKATQPETSTKRNRVNKPAPTTMEGNNTYDMKEFDEKAKDFVKNTIKTYLTTKINNCPDLDRDDQRRVSIDTWEPNEFCISSWGEYTIFETEDSIDHKYVLLRSGGYHLPVGFDEGLYTSLQGGRYSYDTKTIQQLHAIAEISNLTNRMKNKCVFNTETKGCALKYENGCIKQNAKGRGWIEGATAWGHNLLGGVEKYSKQALDKVQSICTQAGASFDIKTFVCILNRMKYDAGMITEEELRDQLGDKGAEEVIGTDIDVFHIRNSQG